MCCYTRGVKYLFKSNDKEYPLNDEKRHFSNVHRYRVANNGEQILRNWLIYSPTSDSVFCIHCRLFDVKCQSKLGQEMGYSNWKNIAQRLCSHEISPGHFLSVKKWVDAEQGITNSRTVDMISLDQIKSEKQKWQEIFKRLVSIILFLAEHNLAFRGSSSKLFTKNNGNFLGLVQLLAKFDFILASHLEKITSGEQHVHMLSPRIQNELITLLADKVKKFIVDKIQEAKYFSVLLDCTPDLSHQEHVSLTLRYLKENEEKKIIVEESFLGYVVAEKTTAEALTELLFTEISKLGLNMEDSRGQGYDNGANMAGCNTGVQVRVLKQYPLCFFVPCGCHSLNRVVCDGAKSSVKSIFLFGILQRLYVLFSASTKRWCIISDYVQNLTLKKVCDTRWEARISSVAAVR